MKSKAHTHCIQLHQLKYGVVRTDTEWFHDFVCDSIPNTVYQGTEIKFICDRINFDDNRNIAPLPSMVVIF